jgi:membrane protease YdiL (CAAX protease family)
MLRDFSRLTKKPAKKAESGNFGEPLRVILTTIGIFLLTQLLAAFLVELCIGAFEHNTDPGGSLTSSAPAQFFYILMAEGLIGFAAFFALLVVINGILSQIFPSLNSEQQDVGFNTLNSALDQVLALLALVILPPLGEETLVRGYLYSGLRSKWKFAPAMIVTSLLFGFAHLELGSGASAVWAAGIDTFVLSLVLVYLRESTNALYAGMLVHGLNNLSAFTVHFH